MKDLLWALYELYAVLSITVITPGVIGLAVLYGVYRRREMLRDRNWEGRR